MDRQWLILLFPALCGVGLVWIALDVRQATKARNEFRRPGMWMDLHLLARVPMPLFRLIFAMLGIFLLAMCTIAVVTA